MQAMPLSEAKAVLALSKAKNVPPIWIGVVFQPRREGGKMAKANIEEARKAITDFLKKTLHAKDVKVIKEAKISDGWEAEAEVYEESSFIKSLGLPTRVMDRNIYEVRLDNDLEVQSYEQKEHERH